MNKILLVKESESLVKDLVKDCISRQATIELCDWYQHEFCECDYAFGELSNELYKLPSAQPERCEGCKHLGKWENEVEYGYPSPCTRCKRRAGDNYDR